MISRTSYSYFQTMRKESKIGRLWLLGSLVGIFLLSPIGWAQNENEAMVRLLSQQNEFLYNNQTSLLAIVKVGISILAGIFGSSLILAWVNYRQALKQAKEALKQHVMERVAKEVDGHIRDLKRIIENEFGVGQTSIFHLPPSNDSFKTALSFLGSRGFKKIEEINSIHQLETKTGVFIFDCTKSVNSDSDTTEGLCESIKRFKQLDYSASYDVIPIFYTGGRFSNDLKELDQHFELYNIANNAFTLVANCADSAQMLHTLRRKI